MSSNDNTEQNSSEQLLEDGVKLEDVSVGEVTENVDNNNELNEEKKFEELPQEVEATLPENVLVAKTEPSPSYATSTVLDIPRTDTAVFTEKQPDILVKNEAVSRPDDNDDGVDDDDDDLFGDGDDDDDDDDDNENPVSETTGVEKESEKIVQPEAIVEAAASIEAAGPKKSEVKEAEVDTKAGDNLKPDNAGTDDVAQQVESTEEYSANASVPIPRKNSGGGSSPVGKKMTYTKAALTALGLPDGVNVPYSVDKERLLNNNPNNRKMMDTLRALPVKLVNDALTEYDDAVQVKGNSIRNHGAYLYGVVKRYVAVHERAVAGGDGTGVLPMGEGLTTAVHQRLEQLVSTGFCTLDEMNDKVKSKIKMLPEKDALFALDELSSVSRSQIRNFGSYFMGILNRYMRGDDHKNNTNSMHNPYQSAASPQQKMPMNNQQQQMRGRDRNPAYRDSNQAAPYDRERSRDRNSIGGGDTNRRFPNSRDNTSTGLGNRPPYDTRQQQPNQNSWQRQNNPQGQQSQQHQTQNLQAYSNPATVNTNVSRSNNIRPSDQQRAGMYQGVSVTNYSSVPQQQQQFNPAYQQQQTNPPNPYQPQQTNPPNPYQPQQQANPPNPYQPQQQAPAALNPYQPQQQQQPNPSNQFGTQGYPIGQPQPYQQQNTVVGANQPYAVNASAPVQSQYMQTPQYQINMANQSQQGQAPSYGQMNPQQQAMPVQQPQRWQQQQQQPQLGQQPSMVPVDIMGLADKAASAVQALSSVNQMQNRNAPTSVMQTTYGGAPMTQQQPPNQMYNAQQTYQPQQQPMYGAPGGNPNVQQYQQAPIPGAHAIPQQQSYLPSQPQQQQHLQSDPMQSSYGGQNNNLAIGNNDPNRRRTTASINQLQPGVQYSIQNLMATQAIEGPLDDGILGMIHDLPEALAVASLQKFAALDKNNMRSRTAYLAGVLRRELEKIQRR